MERIKKLIKIGRVYWPECLILLCCAIFLAMAVSEKKGYHMDELLSFELSNAEFTPWIVPTQPQGRLEKYVEREIRDESFFGTLGNLWETARDVLKNRGSSKLLSYKADVYPEPVWIDREAFREYVTVNREDDFNYLSVYFNVKDDNHPPLHFMLLHTVSSIFKEKLTPWMGCSINLFFVLGTMILLMKTGRLCMKIAGCEEQGRIAGAGAAALYGLSVGATSTTLLIRMYAMLTFFCVWLLYVHLKKLFHEKLAYGFEKNNKTLIVVTILGFWTQYFFLFYCFALALVTGVLLLREKRKTEFKRYVGSMIKAAVIGLLVFPFAVSDVFSSGRGVEALGNLKSGFGDFAYRLGAFLEILGTGEGMLCVFVLVLINFSWGILIYRRKAKPEKGFWAMLLIPVITYFLMASKLSPFLVDRYVMPAFPLVLLLLTVGSCACLTHLLREKTKRVNLILAILLGCLALSQVISSGNEDNEYLYPEYETQEETAKEYAGLPCICVYEGVGYYENLPEFMQYEKTLLVTMEELKGRTDGKSIQELRQVAVLLKNKEWIKDVNDVMAQYGFAQESVAFTSSQEGGDAVLIYSK